MKINNEDFWKDKKVFITGGAGFIGSHLVELLQSLGADIRTFIHTTSPLNYTPWIKGDLVKYDDCKILHNYLMVFKPDVVFHLAAQPLVNRSAELLIETLDINIRGTYGLLSACIGVPSIQSIVHISTDKVYGNLDIITGSDIPNGVHHPYNTSKLSGDIIAQMFCNTFGLPITIIRNGNIYGAGDKHWERIIPGNFLKVLNGYNPSIRGDGSSLRDYIHVSEIVVGFINAADYGWGRTDNPILLLGSVKPYSVREVIDVILKNCNRVDLAPVYEELLQGEIPHQHISDPVSQEKIGWYPTIDLESGIEMTAPYYIHRFKDIKNE